MARTPRTGRPAQAAAAAEVFKINAHKLIFLSLLLANKLEGRGRLLRDNGALLD